MRACRSTFKEPSFTILGYIRKSWTLHLHKAHSVLLTVPTPGLEQRLDADLKEHRILQTQHDATRGLWVKRRHWFLQPVPLALCSKCPSRSPAHPVSPAGRQSFSLCLGL